MFNIDFSKAFKEVEKVFNIDFFKAFKEIAEAGLMVIISLCSVLFLYASWGD